MKCFLSSIRLPNEDERRQLFEDKASPSVAIIPNAWDVYPEERQKTELNKTLEDFKSLGCTTTVVDLVTSNARLRQDLTLYDFVWVMSGNTLYLNYIFHKTGFDKVLKESVQNGLVYGGTSAGAVIAGPTIHGAEQADDPSKAPALVWEGLGLVDVGIVPHWGWERYADALEKMRAAMEPFVPQVVTLTNEQAMVWIDGAWEVR